MLQTKMHARLQITTKMQHLMAKMQKKNSGEGAQPLTRPLPNVEGHIPHPLRRLSQNAFGVRAP